MAKKSNLVTYVIIGENKNTNEKIIYCEVKIKPGEIYPMVQALNNHYALFYYEAVSKEYFQENKEHYKHINK